MTTSTPLSPSTSTVQSIDPEHVQVAARKQATIVVIDDNRDILDLIHDILVDSGHRIFLYSNPKDALESMQIHGADVVLTDFQMPEMNGLALLKVVRRQWPDCKVVIFTGYGSVEDAVVAIKAGAADFLTKPLNCEAIPQLIERLVTLQGNVTQEARRSTASIPAISSNAVNVLYESALAVAPTDCTVLVLGESGVGKEVLSDMIQSNSRRVNQPYIKINCAALSESLIESELFGHERGAFTGANKCHAGRFERAHKGTLFLDEIGELSMSMQTKLLRVLQTHEVERVGGSAPIKIDFRLICATHRNLPEMISQGLFRQDLYYRLNTFPLFIPALRDRIGEIPELAVNFLRRATATLQRGPAGIDRESMALLQSYTWPGNVRELEHCIERACMLAKGKSLQVSDFWWLNIESGTSRKDAGFESRNRPGHNPAFPKMQATESFGNTMTPSPSTSNPHPASTGSGLGYVRQPMPQQQPEPTSNYDMPSLTTGSVSAPVTNDYQNSQTPLNMHTPQSNSATYQGELSLPPLELAERRAIHDILTECHWNFTRAAISLNISRSTLYLKAGKYGLTRSQTTKK